MAKKVSADTAKKTKQPTTPKAVVSEEQDSPIEVIRNNSGYSISVFTRDFVLDLPGHSDSDVRRIPDQVLNQLLCEHSFLEVIQA